MAKPLLERITDPAEGLVHFGSVGLQDGVTLCGQTDWIGQESGEKTDNPVTCSLCLSIVEHIQKHRTH